MFPEFLTETVNVIFMFVVRIGIPIAITLAFGWWLEKRMAPPAQVEEEKETRPLPRYTRTGNIIQIPCWDLKRCESSVRAQCAAFQHPDLPCWLALQADGGKLRPECFTCALYKPAQMAA
jgi:hypothetical protein